MYTSKTYQQSLIDADSETRPPIFERGSYIPWASRFRRYINHKRENQKWLNKALDEGPYQFQMFVPSDSIVPKLQTVKDLQRDALFHYDDEIEVMNLILLSIPNDIYKSVDACTLVKDMWKRVKRLMMGAIQNKVNRETHFTNEFDQFVAEPGEALVSVYNRFSQLMNDLERNDMHFPIVTINTKFRNSLQPELLKYVTKVHLAKCLTVDTFDDLFYYLQQFEKLFNTSRAKKLEKSHDLLALVAHTGSSSRNTSFYYVTYSISMVDYDDEYQQDDIQTNSEDPLTSAMLLLARAITQNFSNPTNNRLRTSSNTRNQAVIQEVAFRFKACYVRSLKGDDLLTGARESNLYTISIDDMAASSPVCLMSKATLTKSWLWHRRLLHLNFGTVNDLTRLDLVNGLLKFKHEKDHLCSACERGKSKKASHPPKLVPSDNSKLELLHMYLCRPMRVASINGKKYILVIVDDYSRYTWVYFLHSKDETLEIIKKFIAQAQLNYKPKKSSKIPINSAAQLTQLHEDSPSTSSISSEEHEAPLIETTSDEQTSPISFPEADELHQEDSANFDGNSQFVSYNHPSYEAIDSSLTTL
nr:integrase, catalytic region, zinc finger, CCHC-type, peptidase aspartic, catalytic [Tanacetum cinerariifolium]